jgi:hypothetical protein
MLTETDDEALEAESRANALLDGATAYEAGRCEQRSFSERVEAVPMPAREQK